MQTPRTSSRVVLVKQVLRAAEARRTAVPVRRFKIARMPLAARPMTPRFDAPRAA